MAEGKGRRKLIALFVLVALACAAVLFLPGWWQRRTDRESRSLARNTGAVLPGSVTGARSKVDPGKPEKVVLELIGKPSVTVETRGLERHAIWTYYYEDGTMTLNMTDGYVVRADLEFGPPQRGTKRE